MSTYLTLQEAISVIPLLHGRDYQVEVLAGGLTNRNYKIESPPDCFVLRLDAIHTTTFSLRRRSEHAIHNNAARAGIAPEILYFDPDHGVMLKRFEQGRVWSGDDLRQARNLQRLAAIIRKVHALPLAEFSFDAMPVAESYASKIAGGSGMKNFAADCLAVIAHIRSDGNRVCCHNDLAAENIVDSRTLCLLDWEYASNNHPFFDLASVICYHDLGKDEQRFFLTSYLQSAPRPDQLRTLESQIRLFDAIQWLWFAVRQELIPSSVGTRRMRIIQERIVTSCF